FASAFIHRRKDTLDDLLKSLAARGIEPVGAEGAPISVHTEHRVVSPSILPAVSQDPLFERLSELGVGPLPSNPLGRIETNEVQNEVIRTGSEFRSRWANPDEYGVEPQLPSLRNATSP